MTYNVLSGMLNRKIPYLPTPLHAFMNGLLNLVICCACAVCVCDVRLGWEIAIWGGKLPFLIEKKSECQFI